MPNTGWLTVICLGRTDEGEGLEEWISRAEKVRCSAFYRACVERNNIADSCGDNISSKGMNR
jgi:hypothetical protein